MGRKRPRGGSPHAGVDLKEQEQPSARASRRFLNNTDAVIFASIFLASLLAYWPAMRGGLVWDDAAHITKPALQSVRGLARIWAELGATAQYYPVLHSAFWFEHRLWGDTVLGYHLANVLQHALSACLVVLILRRLAVPGAWLAGLIFAVHPVCAEAVAWMSEQKSTLSAVFYLASALLYLRFDETRRRPHYLWALGLFFLALASKSVTASLPAALLVIIWWKRGSLSWRRDVRPLLPWLALGLSAGLFTAWVERTIIGARGADYVLSIGQRFLLAGRAICFYAGKVVWPVNLTFTYPRWTLDPSAWWQYLFGFAVLAAGVGFLLLARRTRGPLAAFLIFVGTLFPVLGFLDVYPFVFSFVADHFQYLACLAIIVPLAAGIAAALSRLAPAKAIACGAIVPLVLSVLTWRQAGDYRDSQTLYRATLARNPDSWMAHNNLGVALWLTPVGLPEAIAEYQAALRLKSDEAPTHTNLARALTQVPGRLPEALSEFQAALRLQPNSVRTHNDFGVALSQMPGRLPDAMAEYRAALTIDPRNAEAHNNLGNALMQIPGRLPEAIAEYEAALAIEPDNAETHNNLGSALVGVQGRLPEALAEFETALRVRPDYAEAYNNLGSALMQAPGRVPDAVKAFEAAVRFKPDYVAAHKNLGNALSQMPERVSEAMAEYQAALRLRNDDAETLNDLGVALAGTPGRMPDAILQFQSALRIQPDYVDARENLANALVQTPGRLPEAIVEYQKILRVKPDEPQVHNGLGVALAQTPGRMPEAIAQFQTALRLQPGYAEARVNLERACPQCVTASH